MRSEGGWESEADSPEAHLQRTASHQSMLQCPGRPAACPPFQPASPPCQRAQRTQHDGVVGAVLRVARPQHRQRLAVKQPCTWAGQGWQRMPQGACQAARQSRAPLAHAARSSTRLPADQKTRPPLFALLHRCMGMHPAQASVSAYKTRANNRARTLLTVLGVLNCEHGCVVHEGGDLVVRVGAHLQPAGRRAGAAVTRDLNVCTTLLALTRGTLRPPTPPPPTPKPRAPHPQLSHFYVHPAHASGAAGQGVWVGAGGAGAAWAAQPRMPLQHRPLPEQLPACCMRALPAAQNNATPAQPVPIAPPDDDVCREHPLSTAGHMGVRAKGGGCSVTAPTRTFSVQPWPSMDAHIWSHRKTQVSSNSSAPLVSGSLPSPPHHSLHTLPRSTRAGRGGPAPPGALPRS